MKTFGIIAEYNPFHKGHEFQLQKARQIMGLESAAVIVMSGSFTQRGEPAILDKWQRAHAALRCGANLVLELPHLFATASAEGFAYGAISLLVKSGIVQNIVFGSESGNLTELDELATFLYKENEHINYKTELKEKLKQGLSWPAAREEAIATILGAETASLLAQANNILAIEYLKALKHFPKKQRPKVHTISRGGQAYKDQQLPGSKTFASASSLRLSIAQLLQREQEEIAAGNNLYPLQANLLKKLAPYMPAPSLATLLTATDNLVLPEDLAAAIIMRLRTFDLNKVDQYLHMQEGLGRRLITAAAKVSQSDQRLSALLEAVRTRRFPDTRINRALLAALLDIKADDEVVLCKEPQYIRVLAFDKKGRHLLKLMRKYASLPIVTKASDFLEFSRDSLVYRQSAYDILAADIRSLANGKGCGSDYQKQVIIV